MYDIGILGGMGPLATAVLFDKLISNTAVENDQDHLSVMIANKTSVPDRTAYLLGSSAESPLPFLLEGLRELNAASPKEILIPCNTSHYFINELQAASAAPIRNMVYTVLDHIVKSNLPPSVVVLGTLGTVQTGIYERFAPNALHIQYPTADECRRIHEIIYTIKHRGSACFAACTEDLNAIIAAVQSRFGEPQTFVLGCTELSVLDTAVLGKNAYVVDAMEQLALAAIAAAGKPIKHTVR